MLEHSRGRGDTGRAAVVRFALECPQKTCVLTCFLLRCCWEVYSLKHVGCTGRKLGLWGSVPKRVLPLLFLSLFPSSHEVTHLTTVPHTSAPPQAQKQHGHVPMD
jgi:hypothetical protein